MGGVVHQRINAGLFVENPCRAGVDGGVVAEVAGVDKGGAALGCNRLLNLFELLLTASYQAQGCAFSCHDFGRFSADATGGAGEYNGLAFEFHAYPLNAVR